MSHSIEQARIALRQLGELDMQLAAVAQMTTPQLIATFEKLYGEPTRSRNRDYLRKRLEWRVQELSEGGLPKRALDRITALGDQIPERWLRREFGAARQPTLPRDSRLPPVGTVLTRIYNGVAYEATVQADGVDYKGKRFKSLSALAKQITGKAWNGYRFFGIESSGEEAK